MAAAIAASAAAAAAEGETEEEPWGVGDFSAFGFLFQNH